MSARRTLPDNLVAFGEILLPQEAQEPILAKPVRSALLEWLEEIWCASDLEAVKLKPRRRAVFSGAPGTGKTTLAHHIAARLGLRLLIVRPEKVKSRYIGQSAEMVGALFDALSQEEEPVFLFFDEFDSLAGSRMNSGNNEVGEQDHNHMINTMLAAFDRYEGFIVAATNYAGRVDEALWRRFEIQIALELPGDFERRRILERYFSPFVLPENRLAVLSEAMETASPALMRSFAEHIKRQIIVGPKVGWDMDRDAVLSRVLSTVQPHPEIGKPRLWSLGLNDRAAPNFPWPLHRALSAYPPEDDGAARPDMGGVVPFRKGGA